MSSRGNATRGTRLALTAERTHAPPGEADFERTGIEITQMGPGTKITANSTGKVQQSNRNVSIFLICEQSIILRT